MPRVMVIAGTSDARGIIGELIKNGKEVIATVTTSYGKELLEEYRAMEVYQGKLNAEEMLNLITAKGISCMVDASHPFAREASVNAIDACSRAKIPYLRYERSSTNREEDFIIRVKSFEEAAQRASQFKGNILLAIGSNNLKFFIDKIPDYKERIFARILPDSRMVAKCEVAGFTAGNIIAVQGPFSVDMNVAMLKHCNASLMITKESGDTGGTDEKLEAAARLNIPVIMVERPQIDYGRKVSTVLEVLDFVNKLK